MKNSEKTSALITKQSRNKKTGGMPTWVGTLILVSVLVALVALVAWNMISKSGVIQRAQVAMKSENYEISVPMMSYIVNTEFQNFLNYGSSAGSTTNNNLWQYIRGTGGTALDPSKSLHEQFYSQPTTESPTTERLTWFEYFAGSAKQTLLYCEIASKLGIMLDEQDKATVEAAMQQFRLSAELQAAQANYTTESYIQEVYGKGVNYKEIRKVMELSMLSSKVAELKQDEFSAAVTDARIDAYYLANQAEYDIYLDYMSFSFTANYKNPEDVEQREAAAEKYAADCTLYKDRIAQLVGATSEEEFKELVEGWVYSDAYKLAYDAAIESGEDEEKAIQTATEKADEEVLKQLATLEKVNQEASGDENELNEWLYDKDRVIGDTKDYSNEKAAKNEAGEYEEEASSTYTAYFVTSDLHRSNGETVRSVGHILFKDDTFKNLTNTNSLSGKTKELADRILARGETISSATMAAELLTVMMEEGKLTKTTDGGKTYYTISKDAFEEYGLTYTEDSNVFYDDVKPGDMVAPFNAWLFDYARKLGEITYDETAEGKGAVKTEYGYHIMTYLGNEQELWRSEIATKLANDSFTAWYEAELASFEAGGFSNAGVSRVGLSSANARYGASVKK